MSDESREYLVRDMVLDIRGTECPQDRDDCDDGTAWEIYTLRWKGREVSETFGLEYDTGHMTVTEVMNWLMASWSAARTITFDEYRDMFGWDDDRHVSYPESQVRRWYAEEERVAAELEAFLGDDLDDFLEEF